MAALKTLPNDASAKDFVAAVPDAQRRKDAEVLLKLFKKATGKQPKMWGTSIIGYGMYHYKSERSSQEGDWPLVGFSPRKQAMTVYIMLGAGRYKELLGKLGKHKVSAGPCVYINKLSDIDLGVLERLVERGYKDMEKKYSKK